ncbi:iron-sulfur cluster-binding domain-containing protein [Malacoplasma iowae]|uniref:Flavodoxin reductase, family 1 n=1 Tax=Malacoplasma iowae DK-CPA TaxID=1394179 RepID=A0A084U4V0_MALIO|nr:iron-sulfur cluster-binding domain-containing protein [Malacoplasma iowae]KFB07986.1 flavodoxin reductase, family 1 [Malacoplasma iowae DK-CPA]WPL36726.1 iron-sulfur cluster-binding domain-containing protein [Malacoplasma iowae]WPL41341.1 iron-sulfur cluster-binding domain-containing protein [Malacoplasma iowae]
MQNQKKKILYKKSPFLFMDLLKTKKMNLKRNELVDKQNVRSIKTKYYVNELANSLHPKEHDLKIIDIIDVSSDTKTFVLQPTTNHAAFFRAGQYISISVNIDNYLISRPYSLSCSPLDAKNKNIYQITIKRKPNGYVSNYMLDKVKKGDMIKSTGPQGDFYYTFLRDKKHVVAIAGGSGITPFLSMAKSIVENVEDFNLTILFGNRTSKNILFLEELDNLQKLSNGRVKVVHVLSEEKNSKYENGFIDSKIIQKYCDVNNSSFFVCGPKVMYKFVRKTLHELNVKEKFIRCEASNEIGNPKNYEDYVNEGNKTSYNIKINQNGKVLLIKARADETILVALQKAKISLLSNCLSGQCSWCRVKLISGKVYYPKSFANLRKADSKNKIFYTCSSFPVTDLEISTL